LRTRLAAFVGAGPDEVGLTVNATMGMNFLAHGLELASGDEVVLMAGAHPGGRCGWELRARRDGVRLKWVEPLRTVSHPSELLRAFERATNPRTRVWAIPHLTSGFGGILFPVDEMCVRARSLGVLSVVDGAQSLGQRRIDLRTMGCDAFFASAHKWLLAPTGCGLLFIRRDQQPRWWTTLAGLNWDNHDDGMFRFMQYGAANASLLAGYEAALDFHLALGPGRVHERVIELTRRLREGLEQIEGVTIRSPRHPDMLTGITAWSLDDIPGFELQEALWHEARVRVRAAGDFPTAVRQCCHIYTTMADVERSLAATRVIARPLGGYR
jgi:isopenicillin-N epimerase